LDKAPDAFRTISEVADDLDIPQHVLRFWETRFSQIKPMKRSGGRRYYRPDDVDLLRGIRRLLYGEGYTIRGVQRILKEHGIKSVQGLADGSTATSFGPVEGRASRSTVEDEEDDAAEVDVTDDDEDESDDEAEFEAAPSRREPTLQSPRVEPAMRSEPQRRAPAFDEDAAAEDRAQQRERDTERLKSALSELVACRQLLDDALKGGS
jgi:DNA-binding transcriptional MerR regulator